MEALQTRSIDDLRQLGGIFKASGFFKDIRDEAQAITKILYGQELGFSPIVSIMGVYIVDGKPSLSANLLGAMVKRSGKYDYRVKVSDNTQCVLTFLEKGEVRGDYSFTIEDAKAAMLTGKDNWRKYPKSMLFARALSAGIRTFCPDISACPLYVPEELGATVNADGDVVDLPAPVSSAPITIERPAPLPVPQTTTATTAASSTLTFTVEPDPVPPPPEPEDYDPFEEPYITVKQQQMLARRFRESLREELQPMAEELRHNALAYFKYIDKDGNPSAKMIKAKDFVEVGKKLVAYARGLN